ncbi:sensor domain-containing diguanylate cyclase [Roseinatronobacter alkalisoli]|uniref:diguanylate cyclase n=1 Tax=Roseinatronobacter alkalisoli TaxID=3028235 RepID=A0ABT5TE15_9RHOB|nr:sensor domain-containing diguanylate cyclase [Roseinatronobacter sp. HJB301]MDD7973360.1 sensor domain-containing diguanylate cyclase [Roseinatronobacter sp. HJB301]
MTFISTPKTDDEIARLAALKRYQILDTASEAEFDDITSLVKTVLNVPIAAVSLIDSDRQWFKSILGVDVAETPRSVAFCDHTIRDSCTLQVDDATQDPRFMNNPFVTGPPGLRCYLGVPLQTPDGYNVGALCVMGPEPRVFSDNDSKVLQSFAKLVVSQMELRLISSKDSLTGTLTRAAFERHLRAALAKPEGTQMALILADIDFFKAINDRFGHQAGDAALRVVSATMLANLRRNDVVGRYGGEEFAILLNGISAKDALAFAERLRVLISEAGIPEIHPEKMTISMGLAPQAANLTAAGDWLERADKALYQAKSAGRNRVVMFGDHTEAVE